jgi:glycosyltransferase involved in cell wall biosynthesis
MGLKKLTVVTPVFNEEDVIAEFHRRVRLVLDGMRDRYDARILFVVDRCTDNTVGVLRRIADDYPDAQVLTLSSRFGHQMSLLAGVDHAQDADAIVMMDSDLQHPPELIPQLLEQFERGNDVVYTIRRDTENISMLRKTLGRGFYRMLSYLSDVPIQENAADFRVISTRVARTLKNDIRERSLFLRGILSWIGFNQVGVEYLAAKRAAGKSKYSLSRMMALAAAGILSFSTKPLKMGIFVGVAVAFLGFALGAFTVVDYFVDRSLPSGWTTLVTLLLLFSGVQLIFMGIIGAYIGGIYEEVKGRPHYVIDEMLNLGNEQSRL